MPRVSVLLPVYNTERYLRQAINSVLRQTFEDFELILLDDGSRDGSVAIARQAAAEDARVVLVEGSRQGLVHWLNAGLKMAKGEFIARMDADDISSCDRFMKQVCFLNAHRACCAVGTQAVRIDPDGWPINRWSVPEHHDQIDELHMRGHCGVLIHPSAMMRTDVVRRIGGYRPAFEWAEDYDLYLRLAEVGELANLPDVLLQYRLHPNCVTFARRKAQIGLVREALQEAWVRRNKAETLPPPEHQSWGICEEGLTWSWAQSAFAARNFGTARKHAFKLVWRRPNELRRWALFGGACLGPLAFQLKRFWPYRIGPYRRDLAEL